MFLIKRIADKRIAERVCGSFGVTGKGIFAYAAYKNDEVLATAAFVMDDAGCCTLCGVDTGRRADIPLIDGIARAAFNAQMNAGAKTGCLGEKIPQQVKFALSKLGYLTDKTFDLVEFFSKKQCCR